MITILGTGQVGRAILEQLVSTKPQCEILLVNKSGMLDFDVPARIATQRIDATNSHHLIELFNKSEVVFSCTDVPYQFWNKFYPSLSTAMVDGLKHSKAKLVVADNMYSYGNLKGKQIHEELPHNAKTKKGSIRANLIKNFESNGINERVAIVKSSDFIGPRIEKGVFGIDFLNRIYKNKTINLPGNTIHPHHFTFIEDFAKALVIVAFEPSAYNQIWHVPNAPAISQSDWIELFIQNTGLKINYRSIPKLVIQTVGLFNPFVKELQELSYQFEYPYLIDSKKFIVRFGDISTPHPDIVRKTIQWYHSAIVTK